MEDNKSILDGMPMGGAWHEGMDRSVTDVLTAYSKICDKFKLDKNYGSDFVKNNQALMGQLTIAVLNDMD